MRSHVRILDVDRRDPGSGAPANWTTSLSGDLLGRVALEEDLAVLQVDVLGLEVERLVGLLGVVDELLGAPVEDLASGILAGLVHAPAAGVGLDGCRSVPLVSVVRSVSSRCVMLTRRSGTPSDSAAIMAIVVRWPSPISLAAETNWTMPSVLTMTWPVAGLPPAPWLHAWAARPMPWKTPGRTSLAFGACQFCFQPMRSAACVDAVANAGIAERLLGVRIALLVQVLQAELRPGPCRWRRPPSPSSSRARGCRSDG